jgi:hypothetical protein
MCWLQPLQLMQRLPMLLELNLVLLDLATGYVEVLSYHVLPECPRFASCERTMTVSLQSIACVKAVLSTELISSQPEVCLISSKITVLYTLVLIK